MTRYEYASVVLHFEAKAFALTRSDVLQGLAEGSTKVLNELGDAGWELVSTLPYTTVRREGTDAAMAFFKRVKA